jgi:hypothetical protein
MYRILSDVTLNDSNKDFIVPAGRQYKIEWVHASLASTAVVGNRQMNIALYDPANVLQADWHSGAVQAASLTRHYMFQPGMYRETAFVDGEIQIAIPINLIVPAEWYLKVYDALAIDAAADDMLVTLGINDMSMTARDAVDQY